MAAITYSQTGTGNRWAYPDLLDVTFDEVKATMDKVPLQGEEFFATRKASRMEYKHSMVGSILDLPTESEDEDDLPFVQPAPSYDTTFTLVNYRNAVKITSTLLETDQHAVIKDMFGGLFKSYQRHCEYQYANVFNNSFSDTGADGVALFSDSHTHADALAGLWDNLNSASDITPDSYFNMRLNMQNRTDEKGNINPLVMDKIVTCADKERRAREVIGSDHTADVQLNNINPFKNEVKLVIWNWLTSSTAWFGCDSTRSDNEKGLFKIERIAPNVKDCKDDPSVGTDIVFARRLRFSNAVGATIPYAWDGNSGA